MYNFLKEAHSGWAYLVLILLLVAGINALMGASSKRAFMPKDRKLALFALIATHIQLLIAMFLYFLSPYYAALKASGMGAVMKDSGLRLYLIEHPLINIIAIILVTIGWSKHKTKATDVAKFKSIGIMYLIALVLILSRLPWNAWFA
ncbi:MAG TPA: hypothetical protein VLZ11_04875 [Flavobacterium sp.]|nr:hypothetical protein [Flavobacterium sp.]